MTDLTPVPVPEIEEAVQPTGTQPVAPQAAGGDAPPPGPRRRLRWAIALVTVAVLAVATLGGAVLLAGARVDSTVARWAPADAFVYAEIRADLPGDQRQALGEFLSAFPGFADQTILDRKLDELYDRLVSAATSGKQSWAADIAPWFGGQLGLAVGPLQPVASLEDEQALVKAVRTLAIATVTDPTKARDWVLKMAAEHKLPVTWADADAIALLLIGPGDGPVDQRVAAAVTDDVLLVGDETSVRAALARGGSGGLASDAGFKEAVAGLADQQTALGYVDTAAIVRWVEALPSTSSQPIPAAALDRLPPWHSGGLRFESDALVLEGLQPRTAGTPDVPNERSKLPERLPASTIALAETHDLAAGLDAITQGDPEAARQLEGMLAPAGGLDALLGWAGETGVVVLEADGKALPGVVAIATDPAKADAAATSLRNLATLAGLHPTEETVDGVTVVSVDLRTLPGMTGATMAKEPLVVSWAVSGDLVVVGQGPTFVRAILAAPSGSSLSDVDAFRRAVDRAGASHQALAWVDLDAVERLVVDQLSATERSTFEREVRPYLAPLGALVATVTRDGDLQRSRTLLVLDQ